MNIEAFAPYVVGLVTAISAWYLGQQKQHSEIVEKSRQLTMSEMEWVKQQTEKRFADLITERDYYRGRVSQLDALLDAEREQSKNSRLSLEQTVSSLSGTCEQQRQEINELEIVVESQRKEIDRLNFVIGG